MMDEPSRGGRDTVTITLPTFAGYKTLFVNTAIALLALLAVLAPGTFSGVTPDQIGAAYEQITGAIVLVVNILNIFLRLMTAKPPAVNPLGVQPPITETEHVKAQRAAFEHGVDYQAKQEAWVRAETERVRAEELAKVQAAERSDADLAARREAYEAQRREAAIYDASQAPQSVRDAILTGGPAALAAQLEKHLASDYAHDVPNEDNVPMAAASGRTSVALAFWCAFGLPPTLLAVLESAQALTRLVA